MWRDMTSYVILWRFPRGKIGVSDSPLKRIKKGKKFINEFRKPWSNFGLETYILDFLGILAYQKNRIEKNNKKRIPCIWLFLKISNIDLDPLKSKFLKIWNQKYICYKKSTYDKFQKFRSKTVVSADQSLAKGSAPGIHIRYGTTCWLGFRRFSRIECGCSWRLLHHHKQLPAAPVGSCFHPSQGQDMRQW